MTVRLATRIPVIGAEFDATSIPKGMRINVNAPRTITNDRKIADKFPDHLEELLGGFTPIWERCKPTIPSPPPSAPNLDNMKDLKAQKKCKQHPEAQVAAMMIPNCNDLGSPWGFPSPFVKQAPFAPLRSQIASFSCPHNPVGALGGQALPGSHNVLTQPYDTPSASRNPCSKGLG